MVSQSALERSVVAATLRALWSKGLDKESDWTSVRTLAVEEVRFVYDNVRSGLKALMFYDALPELARDRRHIEYHWQHSSFLVAEFFDALAERKLRAEQFAACVEWGRTQLNGALIGPALEDIAKGYSYRGHVADPALITALKDIDSEYLEFLARHPHTLDRIRWEAFEKIAAEIYRALGYEVQHIGTCWGLSADLLVLNRKTGDRADSMIVECKRYGREHRVGIDIVNAVLGSKLRGKADAAFLVTTSTFSSYVERERDNLRRLDLHLRDGDQLIEWLQAHVNQNRADTKPSRAEEVWLPPGWHRRGG